jgi:hypothetical protein
MSKISEYKNSEDRKIVKISFLLLGHQVPQGDLEKIKIHRS